MALSNVKGLNYKLELQELNRLKRIGEVSPKIEKKLLEDLAKDYEKNISEIKKEYNLIQNKNFQYTR